MVESREPRNRDRRGNWGPTNGGIVFLALAAHVPVTAPSVRAEFAGRPSLAASPAPARERATS